jgi:hypothetical protein
VRTRPHVIAVFSSTRLPGFIGRDFFTTTGSSATSHHVGRTLELPLAAGLTRISRFAYGGANAARMMPGFPSYCAGSLFMITSSSTYCRCPCIGHRDFSHTRPDSRPNQVRLRYVPSTSYRFLQTSPLASDALASRILFPMDGARSLTSSDRVASFAGQTSSRVGRGDDPRPSPLTEPYVRVRIRLLFQVSQVA